MFFVTRGDGGAFKAVVIDGALKHNGMAAYGSVFKPEEAEALYHYLIKRANDDKAAGLR